MDDMKTRDSIQLSYGRYLDWKNQNPILLPGEFACVLDDNSLQPIAVRFGNGLKAFNDLPSIPLVATGEKYLTDERALVYTQEEIDEIQRTLDEYIKAVEASLNQFTDETNDFEKSLREKMDPDRSPENPLLALSSVLREIESAIVARFGRVLSKTDEFEGAYFASAEELAAGPTYYQGRQVSPKKYDCANVVGADDIFIYDGEAWGMRANQITAAQKATLDSGITAELVEQLKPVPGQITKFAEDAEEAARNSAAAVARVNELATGVANKIVECYVNTITINERHLGRGYQRGMPVTITDPKSNDGMPIHGFVLSTGVGGTIETEDEDQTCIFFEFTKQQITEQEYEIKPEEEYADAVTEIALGTISSVKTSQDLWESQDYLKRLLDFRFNDIIHKGGNDGELKGIRDGVLTPLYSSDAVIYVDGDRGETGTGIEVDPYSTINEAIQAIKSDAAGTTIVINATKRPYAIVSAELEGNVSFVGYAVGGNAITTVTNFDLSKKVGAEKLSIGFRDLTVTSGFNLTGFNTVYLDNVTITPGQTINLERGGRVHMTHCSIDGTLTINGSGEVYLDCCSFKEGSQLHATDNITVFVEGCTNVFPVIKSGCSYIHFSGTCLSVSGSIAGDFSDAELVALYSGAALKKGTRAGDYDLTTIAARRVKKLVLGSFLFDKANSDIEVDARPSLDGLDSAQVVGPFISEEDKRVSGYLVEDGKPNTVEEHLRAISKKLYAITGTASSDPGQVSSGVVTSVVLRSGGVNGTITLEYFLSDGTSKESRDVAVLGLKSAAYRDASDFALNSSFTEAKGELDSLKTTVSQNSNAISGLQSEQGVLQGSVTTLQGDVREATEKAGNAKSKADENEKAIQALQTKVDSLGTGGGTSGGGSSGSGTGVSSEEVEQLKGRVSALESSKEDVANRTTTLGENSSEHTKYPTAGAVVSALNDKVRGFEVLTNKLEELGDSTTDTTHYPTVGAVNKGLATRIPMSRLPSDDDSEIVTRNSYRDIASQRTLIPNQTAHSNEDDIFGSIEIVKDSTTVFWDITSPSAQKVTSTQLQKGDLVSYFSYLLGGDTIKFAHMGPPSGHSDTIQGPAVGDYYLDITTYNSKVSSADEESEVKDITDVLYRYSGSIWQSETISGKEIASIARAQGRAQWTGTAWAIISSPAQAFSRDQLVAINSGITSAIVQKLKGTEPGHSVTDLTGCVYDEITAKLDKDRVPVVPNGLSLLVAPTTSALENAYKMGTKQIVDSDTLAATSPDDNDDKIPTVKSVRSVAAKAADAAKQALDTSLKEYAANQYQPKLSASFSGKLLVGPSVAGAQPDSLVITKSGTALSGDSAGTQIPNDTAVKEYVASVKATIDATTSQHTSQLSSLEETVSGQGSTLTTLSSNVENNYVKKEMLWKNSRQPVASEVKGTLVSFDSDGHLVSSGKQASDVVGTIPLTTAEATPLSDGATYVISPSLGVSQVMNFRVKTDGKTFVSGITFKTAETYPPSDDTWNYSAFLSVQHTDEGSEQETSKKVQTFTIASSIVPISLEKITGSLDTGVTKNDLRFVSSKVYLYARSYEYNSNYLFPDSNYEFVDSEVSIDIKTNIAEFKGKFTRCVVHVFGKTTFAAATTFTDCIVYLHSAEASFIAISQSNVKGTLFFNEASKDEIEIAGGGKVSTISRVDAPDGYKLASNLNSTALSSVATEVKNLLLEHEKKVFALTHYNNQNDTVQLGGGAHLTGGSPIHLTIDNVANARGLTSSANIPGTVTLGNGKTINDVLDTSTGYVKKLDGSSTKVGSQSLSAYIKSQKVNNAVSADSADSASSAGSAARADYATRAGVADSCSGTVSTAETAQSCSGNSATATTAHGFDGTVSVSLLDSKIADGSDFDGTRGDKIVVTVGSSSSKEVVIKTVESATKLKVYTDSGWQDATMATYDIQPGDWE